MTTIPGFGPKKAMLVHRELGIDGVDELVLAVRVDNSRHPNSRYYTGSGIYRHTWMTIADPLHVGHWGTYVTTPRADSAAATGDSPGSLSSSLIHES